MPAIAAAPRDRPCTGLWMDRGRWISSIRWWGGGYHVRMASVFTKIIDGELPGRFVYRDDEVVAFLTIEPVAYGHVLVVPVREIDRWTDLEPELWARCNEVAQMVGNAVVEVFDAPRAGYLIAGFEVPHAHIHVFPAADMSGYDLGSVNREPDPAKMDEAAAALRERLGTAEDGRPLDEA